MGKRGPQIQQKNGKKKKEIYFNFKALRANLNDKQKTKLINFFTNFRSMYITVKRHLFQVNKMYDSMEQEYKKFQRDLFKDDEFLSNNIEENKENKENKENINKEDSLILEEDVVDQIFKDDEKKTNSKIEENKKNDEDQLVDLAQEFLDKDLDEILNETKKRYDNNSNIINSISEKIKEESKNEKIECNNLKNINMIMKKTEEKSKKIEDDDCKQKFFDYKTWTNKI